MPQHFGPLIRVLSPDPHYIIRVDRTGGTGEVYNSIETVFEVYSEDLGKGDNLYAGFILDDDGPPALKAVIDADSLHCGSADIALQAARRNTVEYQPPPGLRLGCHVLRLVVGRDPLFQPSATEKPAVATWWLDVNDTNDQALMAGCPGATKRGSIDQDAGTTGGGSL